MTARALSTDFVNASNAHHSRACSSSYHVNCAIMTAISLVRFLLGSTVCRADHCCSCIACKETIERWPRLSCVGDWRGDWEMRSRSVARYTHRLTKQQTWRCLVHGKFDRLVGPTWVAQVIPTPWTFFRNQDLSDPNGPFPYPRATNRRGEEGEEGQTASANRY